MKSIYDLTPEERKRANPDAVRHLLRIAEKRLENQFLTSAMRDELIEERRFYIDLLHELGEEVYK